MHVVSPGILQSYQSEISFAVSVAIGSRTVRPPICRGTMRQEEDMKHAQRPGRGEVVCKASYVDPRSRDFLYRAVPSELQPCPVNTISYIFSILFGLRRDADYIR